MLPGTSRNSAKMMIDMPISVTAISNVRRTIYATTAKRLSGRELLEVREEEALPKQRLSAQVSSIRTVAYFLSQMSSKRQPL
jgi:hypothetical protein